MDKKTLYTGGLVASVVFFLIGVYYLIPGVNHFFVSDNPTAAHLKHAIVFMGIAVVALGIALVNRKKIS